jgi:chitinase
MVAGSFSKGFVFGLGLLSLGIKTLSAQDLNLRTFALEGGLKAAAEDNDYTCSKTKDCKIGCCGAL